METKSIFNSKTMWGAFTVLAAQLLPVVMPMFGYQFTTADGMSVVEIVSSVVSAGGALLAIYGRVKATKAIAVK